MFTVTFVLHEKSGLDRREALRYWREQHGPVVAAVPGVQGYVQQHAVAGPDGERLPTAFTEEVVVVG